MFRLQSRNIKREIDSKKSIKNFDSKSKMMMKVVLAFLSIQMTMAAFKIGMEQRETYAGRLLKEREFELKNMQI